jgi:hypothetical protein
MKVSNKSKLIYTTPQVIKLGKVSKLTLKTGSTVDGGTEPGFV